MDNLSQTDESVTIGRCKTSRLLFADNLVLLASFESGLQHTFNRFAVACDIAGIKISTFKTEVFHLSRNSVKLYLLVGGVSLKQVKKFTYLVVAFTSDGRQDEKLDVRSGKACAVMQVCTFSCLKTGATGKCKTLGVYVNIRPYPHLCS